MLPLVDQPEAAELVAMHYGSRLRLHRCRWRRWNGQRSLLAFSR